MNTAARLFERAVRRLLTIGCLWMAAASGVFLIGGCAQTSPANPSSARPGESKSAAEKSRETQSSAKPKAHHFYRVLIILLGKTDYEVSLRDKKLSELANHTASFSHFPA